MIQTGGGTVIANTRKTYDAFGRATAVSRLVSGSAYLTDNFSYNANGTIATHTDVNGTIFTHTNGACNNLLLTNLSGGGLSSSFAWDCNGGVRTSTTDTNGKITNYSYVS